MKLSKRFAVIAIATSLLGAAPAMAVNDSWYGMDRYWTDYFSQSMRPMQKLSQADKKRVMEMQDALMKMEADHQMTMSKMEGEHKMAMMKMQREIADFLATRGAQ